jgi:phosphoglycolate phosphatase
MTSSDKAMVLFDIDGTLISKAGPAHRRALEFATRTVTGHSGSLDGVLTHGKLDRDLILQLAQRSVSDPDLQEIYQLAEQQYEATCPNIEDRVCPGALQLLQQLQQNQIPMGLVTGNLTQIAWTKLSRAGLDGFFQFGAFSGMADTRAELVSLAMAQTSATRAASAKISLIGDHYHDMQAAKANGIQAVGVATGALTVEELLAAGANIAVETLNLLSWKDLV